MPEDTKNLDPAMIALAKALSAYIKETVPDNVGFALMLFDFHEDGFYWISNGDRQDITNALREVIRQNDVH